MSQLKEIFQTGKRTIEKFIIYHSNAHVQVERTMEYLGSDYGGWCICSENIDEKSIIYSFGIGEDISFDLAMIEKYGVDIYAFDPTPKSIKWIREQRLPKEFKLFEYGIANFDGIALFNPPENPDFVSYSMIDKPTSSTQRAIEAKVYRLETIMNMLGHQHIDILKMDIEGAEYPVIQDMLLCKIKVRQLLVEFHHRFENIGIKETKKAIKLLVKNGYKIFHISSSNEEYSFIRD
ncbi:MAG: FkbM family methyltransferase [Paenibacillus sp.]|nr:FkbM family methyltransferase [Paenibacillus sp.]